MKIESGECQMLKVEEEEKNKKRLYNAKDVVEPAKTTKIFGGLDST